MDRASRTRLCKDGIEFLAYGCAELCCCASPGAELRCSEAPFVNEDVVEQKSSIHCHSWISSINVNDFAELEEVTALVNEDVVAQSSIHCHSQISSTNANA